MMMLASVMRRISPGESWEHPSWQQQQQQQLAIVCFSLTSALGSSKEVVFFSLSTPLQIGEDSGNDAACPRLIYAVERYF